MKTKTREIISRQTQIFEQGELGEVDFENPLQFQAWVDCITINQGDENILLLPDAVEPFIKALRNFKNTCYPK